MVYEQDEWSVSGPLNVLSQETIAKLKAELEVGPLIVEHRHYRGSRAPDRVIFDEFDDLIAHLKERSRPGDAIHVWSYETLCRDDNALVSGKVPDAQGRTPKRGAY